MMERIKVPNGSKQNFETVFDLLQSFQETNISRRLKRMIGEWGVRCTEKNGTVTSTEFAVSHESGTSNIRIQPGKALTQNLDFLETTSVTTKDLSSSPGTAGDYTVLAKATTYSDTPVDVINGFLYGNSDGTKDTQIHESVEFDVVASGTTATTSGIYLANITWDGAHVVDVYDRRQENVLSLWDSVIPDTNIVKKDRTSTISATIDFDADQNFLQKVRIGDSSAPEHELDVQGIIRATNKIQSNEYTSDSSADIKLIPGKDGGAVLIQVKDATGTIKFLDENGSTLGWFDGDNFEFNEAVYTKSTLKTLGSLLVENGATFSGTGSDVILSGVSNEEFRLGIGTLGTNNEGVKVLTENIDPTPVKNLRIYDINPNHNSPGMQWAEVTFKWNWENLTGAHYSADGTNTLRVEGVLGDSDALNVTQNALQDFYIYSGNFGASDNKYKIESNAATSGGATVLTLEDAYNNEAIDSNNPGKVITDGDNIHLKFLPYDGSGSPVPKKAWVRRPDDEVITGQTFTIDLPLGMTLTSFARATKGQKEGSWTEMSSGSYDPDHGTGSPDQAVVSYSKPFTVALPNLSDDGADLTLTTSKFGFFAEVSGWQVSGNADETAHQYEFAYTTLDSIDWNDHNDTTHVITEDTFLGVSTNYIRKYVVGVRPLQNQSSVGTAITKEVTSGAGGTSPTDQAVLNGVKVDIRTFSGTVTYNAGTTLWDLTSVKTPSGSSTSTDVSTMASYLSQKVSILKDSAGNEYMIDSTEVHADTGTSTVIVNLLNFSGDSSTPTDGSFTINTTERGRQIKVLGNMQIEYDSVIGYWDCDIIKGASESDPAVLRVCQNTTSGESYADLLEIHSSDAAAQMPTDFSILRAHGTLGLLFDAYDPSDTPNNTASITGRFTLYMRPKIQRDDPVEF